MPKQYIDVTVESDCISPAERKPEQNELNTLLEKLPFMKSRRKTLIKRGN